MVSGCITHETEDYTVMNWLMHPLLALIANATESEMAKYVEYLKVENQILRDRLPKKIDTTEAERDKLLKVGKPLRFRSAMTPFGPFSDGLQIAEKQEVPECEFALL